MKPKFAAIFLLALAVVIGYGTVGSSASAAELRLLTWKGYAPADLVEKFEKETKIKVQITYTNNEEMIAKLRATRGGGFDLAQPSQDRIAGPQKEFNIYRPIDMGKIKKDQIIASMLKATSDNTTVKGKPYGVPHVWGTSGMIVNTKKAGDAKDYLDLCNPQYSGRISYRLKRPTLVAFAFSMGKDPFKAANNKSDYEKLMNEVGEKLIECKKYVKTYWANGDALLGLIRSGEVDVAMGWDGGGWKVGKENPDVKFVAPTSGALGWVDTFALPAKAKNLDAAYKWINFMLRPENAASFTNQENYFTASKDASKFVNKEVAASFEESFPPAAIDNIKWYPPIDTWAEKIEGDILEKVKASGS